MFVHYFNFNHSLDFDGAHLIFNCRNLAIRRIAEASFIRTSGNNSVNSSSGFFEVSNYLASLVVKSIK